MHCRCRCSTNGTLPDTYRGKNTGFQGLVNEIQQAVVVGYLQVRPKKKSWQLDPTYQNQPTLDFFYENTVCFFRWGLYN